MRVLRGAPVRDGHFHARLIFYVRTVFLAGTTQKQKRFGSSAIG